MLNRRSFLKATGGSALATHLLRRVEPGAAGQTSAQAQAASKLNILFVLMDNLGYGEVGVYGGGVLRGAPTPRIDRLATEGTRLTNFNVEAQCTPSRSAILTGRFAIRSGTHSVPRPGSLDGLTQWEVTLAETLSAAGLCHRRVRQVASGLATDPIHHPLARPRSGRPCQQ
jgi:arylsulfatase